MFRFIKNIVFLFVYLILSLLLLLLVDQYFIGNQYSRTYNASLVDKYYRLQNVDSPKIVLIGNSNLAFGVNSEVLSDAFGMPVVNMGYLGSLGNAFHERMVYDNIGEGDIVVVAHTTYSDDDGIGYLPGVWITLDCNRQLYCLLRPKDIISAIPAYPNYLRNAIILCLSGRGNSDTEDSYSRGAFNEYGDVVKRVESSQMDPESYFSDEKNKQAFPEINDICIERLNEMNDYINNCGATMVVAAYPIAYGEYTGFTDDNIREYQEDLAKHLDCQVISDFTDYFYPYDYFYDQMYHLNDKGVEIRTKQLVKDLRKCIR